MAETLGGGAARLRAARRRAGVAAAAGVLILVGGCASLTNAAGASSAPPSDRTGWSPAQVDVTTVLPGDDPSTVLLRTEANVAPECVGEPGADVSAVEGGRIFATVTAPYAPETLVYGSHCATGTAVGEVLLELGSVPDDTVLVLNFETWEPDGAGGYQRCDEYLGCGTPPEDPCDGYLGRFVSQLDIPQHTARGVESCDGTWMVYSVDPAASFCGPVDGPATCTVASRLRYAILRFDPSVPAWVVQDWVSAQRTCAEVRESLPDLPEAMCTDVEAAR